MIHPRATTYRHVVNLDEALNAYHANAYVRPIAYCALCGARLSRYRYPGETRCAPCITKHTATLAAEDLHPAVMPREMAYECPNCGGQKYRDAKMCRGCDKKRRAAGC